MSRNEYGTHEWSVLLIGGASAVGKTSASFRLAQHFGVSLTEIDDLTTVVENMTSAAQYPEVHLRSDLQTYSRISDEQKLTHALSYAALVAEPLACVVANHLRTARPIILEGDLILPEFAAREMFNGIASRGRVKSIFIYDDEGQIALNLLTRDGSEQQPRARASALFSEWLCREAHLLGIPTVRARPWETIAERLHSAIAHADPTSPEA